MDNSDKLIYHGHVWSMQVLILLRRKISSDEGVPLDLKGFCYKHFISNVFGVTRSYSSSQEKRVSRKKG